MKAAGSDSASAEPSPTASPRRRREEIANSITHAIGLLASLVGASILVDLSVLSGDAWRIVGTSVFGVTLVGVYAASTLYHSLPQRRAKRVMRVLDHCAIYLLIAGTYTPITLINLRGGWGWTLFGLAWGLAVAGIVFKLFCTGRFQVLSTIGYLLMGWMCLIAIEPLLRLLSGLVIALLVAGGVAYTLGTLFYHSRRVPYAHAVWHLFVLAGSTFHFAAVAVALSLDT